MRLEDPDYAPRAIKTLCKYCWNADPDKRPEFEDILSFIEHNFKIKTPDDSCDSGRYSNMYSITYARLQFHETTIKNHFQTILQSINISSSQRSTEGKTKDCISENLSPENNFSLSSQENKNTLYKAVDPVRSQALMACQLELEIEKCLKVPKPDKGQKISDTYALKDLCLNRL